LTPFLNLSNKRIPSSKVLAMERRIRIFSSQCPAFRFQFLVAIGKSKVGRFQLKKMLTRLCPSGILAILIDDKAARPNLAA